MTQNNGGITGLVLHYRTPEKTLACLASLCDEGIQHTVIVDNSQDVGKSLLTMKKGLADMQARGMSTSILQPNENLGFAAGVNKGLADIQKDNEGEHVLLINSDAQLLRGAIQVMAEKLMNADIVVPQVREPNVGSTHTMVRYYQSHFALCLRRPVLATTWHPSGCCLLIHRVAIDNNLLDSDFFFYGEDVMLGHRIRQRNLRATEAADAVITHSGSASSRNGSLFYEYHMARAHWLLAGKLANNPAQQLCYLLGRCLSLPLRATLRSLRSCSMYPWTGLCMATMDTLLGRTRSLTPTVDKTAKH